MKTIFFPAAAAAAIAFTLLPACGGLEDIDFGQEFSCPSGFVPGVVDGMSVCLTDGQPDGGGGGINCPQGFEPATVGGQEVCVQQTDGNPDGGDPNPQGGTLRMRCTAPQGRTLQSLRVDPIEAHEGKEGPYWTCEKNVSGQMADITCNRRGTKKFFVNGTATGGDSPGKFLSYGWTGDGSARSDWDCDYWLDGHSVEPKVSEPWSPGGRSLGSALYLEF